MNHSSTGHSLGRTSGRPLWYWARTPSFGTYGVVHGVPHLEGRSEAGREHTPDGAPTRAESGCGSERQDPLRDVHSRPRAPASEGSRRHRGTRGPHEVRGEELRSSGHKSFEECDGGGGTPNLTFPNKRKVGSRDRYDQRGSDRGNTDTLLSLTGLGRPTPLHRTGDAEYLNPPLTPGHLKTGRFLVEYTVIDGVWASHSRSPTVCAAGRLTAVEGFSVDSDVTALPHSARL